MTGGLGPTDDDRTKEAVARVFDRALVRDEAILLGSSSASAAAGRMPKVNEKQADVIEGASSSRIPGVGSRLSRRPGRRPSSSCRESRAR